ncbi:carbohydrate-binding protein [Cellvibrio sp. BR]|uniref:carbohydrate-binding protein n=1 Tax=Cellvibrio sp. BR TaxID=1134474 RepID=UPI00068185E1|nr:carbohydrate-binding protein [Cellvibrio sp. BR]
MAGNIKATRLGDILREKGLLREDQLQLAIAEQKRRRATVDPSDKRMMDATSLGEILIEMGYITRQQLKRGLNWQMYLRKMTLVMSLVAPMMSAAGGAVAQTTTTNTTTSSSSTTSSLVIQAENFSAMKGIKVEATKDTGGGSNIGAIDPGDWLAYENTVIEIAVPTTYKITYRLSSPQGGSSFYLYELDTDTEYDRVTVPKTGSWQTWVSVEQTVTLPAGRHTLGIKALSKGFNINWFKLDKIAEEAPAPTSSSSQPSSVAVSSSSQPSSVAVSSSSQPSSVAVSSSSQPSSVAVSSSSQPSSVAVSSSSQPSSVAVSSSSQPSSVAVSSSSQPSSAAVSSTASSTGTAPTTSLRIESEAYTAMGGIKVEPTTDEGGGFNIGAIDASDWLAYGNHEIHAPTAGNYKVSYRVSSLYGGGSFYLYNLDTGHQFAPVAVPKTGGFQKWITIEQTITLPAGTHKLGITALVKGFNLNWMQVDYKGIALPVTIQAEDFAAMSGIKVEATTDVGGGSNIGAIDAGDWLSYENKVIDIPVTGNYKVTYRTSSLYGGGSFAFHEADGSKQYDVVAVPKTGGFQKWVDVERIVTLEAGSHIFGMTALAKGYNINWFKIEEAPAGSVPSNTEPVSSSSSSSSSTSSVASSTSSQTSSAPVVSSSSSSSAAPITSSSSSSAASSLGSEGSAVAGPVYLRWNIPSLREDGTTLDISELGGYEVRYRRLTDTEYTYVSVENAYTNELNLAWLEGTYVFEVAAFDKNGLYSRFIKIAPN